MQLLGPSAKIEKSSGRLLAHSFSHVQSVKQFQVVPFWSAFRVP